MTRKIIGIGETVLDIVFREGQPQAAVPGGSVFNSMISLGRTAGRLSPEIRLLMESQVGDDAVADLVADFMEKNGVGIEGIRRAKGQSTVSLAMLDAANNAHYEFYRDKDLPPFRTPETPVAEGDIVIFGSFFAVSPVTGRQTREFVSRAKDAGAIVYYDINFRKNHPAERALFEANIALADIVRGSSEDIEYLYGSSEAAGVYREFIAPLCPNFICTRGGEDAEVFSPGVHAAFPTAPIEKVVSTIGAGDNFNAGIIYGLVRNAFSRQDVKALRRDDWEVLVPVAMKFSANVCGSLFNYVDTDFADSI